MGWLLRSLQDPTFMQSEWLSLAQLFGFKTLQDFQEIFWLVEVAFMLIAVILGTRKYGTDATTKWLLFVIVIVAIMGFVLQFQPQWILIISVIMLLSAGF